MLPCLRCCIALFASLAVSAGVSAAVVLQEDFEDGMLDPRISVSTVGTFLDAPGITSFSSIEGANAFGFGRSVNRFNSFDRYVTNLIIDLGSPTFVESLSFDEMEVFGNWGSRGEVYVDGVLLDPSPSFGRSPYNDFISDTTFRSHTFAINGLASILTIQVWDITDLSEIYIDRIAVAGGSVPGEVSLPSSALLAVPPLLFLVWQQRRKGRIVNVRGAGLLLLADA